MNNHLVYYSVKKVPDSYNGENSLPNNILEHVKSARKANIKDSLYAWQSLKELSKINLEGVSFLKSGKPVHKKYAISISHSKGYVAIAFSNSLTELGIDVEKIENKDLSFLTKISKKFNGKNTEELYNLWTMHEATIKALNLNVFKDNSQVFYGITKTFENLDGKFSLSIYNKGKIIEYEDKN